MFVREVEYLQVSTDAQGLQQALLHLALQRSEKPWRSLAHPSAEQKFWPE